jgi:hypothetical protein
VIGPTEPPAESRRVGCWAMFVVLCLTPGLVLLGFGAWVHANGGNRAVLVAGGAFLLLGSFVLLVLRRATRR